MSISTTSQPKIDRPSSVEIQTFDDTSFQPQVSGDPQLVTNDERSIRSTSHHHNGQDAPPIRLMDVIGIIQTVSVAPTTTPKNMSDQFKLYSNAGTFRLYVFVADSAGVGSWRYVVLT